MDLLQDMMARRAADARDARRRVAERELRAQAASRAHHSLRERLRRAAAPRIIAEVKRASPSRGRFPLSMEPAALARLYEQNGAAAISVLTEPHRFLGSDADLRAVRDAVGCPVLRKDFISCPYQVAEAAAWGADCVLLIAAGLARTQLAELHVCAAELGLESLVESHSAPELEAALECPDAIIGVNCRDLRTFATDLAVSESLGRLIPVDRLSVAESGIGGRPDIDRLTAAGYEGFLIGERLVTDPDPAAALRALRGA